MLEFNQIVHADRLSTEQMEQILKFVKDLETKSDKPYSFHIRIMSITQRMMVKMVMVRELRKCEPTAQPKA